MKIRYSDINIIYIYLFIAINLMETGTVKFFNESKGFGFITQDDGKEIFVHVSGLKQDIRQNDKVEFEVEEGKKGLSAVNVRLA